MSTRRQLRLATEAAWKAVKPAAGTGFEPRPGDVFVIPETSHLAVEWAVIDGAAILPSSPPGSVASRRLYAVPADTWRQIGSHDVHVEAASACGPLSLRCGLGLWLPPETFDPDLRSGVLESADLARVRRTWRSIEQGAVDAAESQHDTDAEVEYRDWIEKGPAQAKALLERQICEPVGSRKSSPRPLRTLALAASLLLAMTLAAGGGILWHLRTQTREPVHGADDPWTITLVRTRGVPKIPVPSGARTLELRIGDSYPEPYRVEVRSEDPPRTIRTSESPTVVLPTRALAAGEYHILVLAVRDGRKERIGDYRIEIEYRENEHHP